MITVATQPSPLGRPEWGPPSRPPPAEVTHLPSLLVEVILHSSSAQISSLGLGPLSLRQKAGMAAACSPHQLDMSTH